MPAILYTFFISMLPIIELRGGEPIGVAMGLDIPTAFVVAILGNLLPIPFVLLFIRKFINWLKPQKNALGKFATWLDDKGKRGANKIGKYEFWEVLIFVAIPFPGTGAWTGALIAVFLNMPFWKALSAIVIGVIIAGIVMGIACVSAIWAWIIISVLCFLFLWPFIKMLFIKRENK